MSISYRRAIVVGASSGIGAELTKQLAGGGCKVAAVARRLDLLETIAKESGDLVIPVEHDVTDYSQAPLAFQEASARLGGLDLVIYCAGVMPEMGPEEYNFEKDRQIFEVNVLGAISWLNQAAMRFGKVGAGAIVAVGSVAGDRGRAGQPAYNASKAALATYMEALRNRLSSKGVSVALFKPGPTATPMTKNLGMKNLMPASQAAEIILRKGNRTGEHYLKPTHRAIFFVIRNIPSPIFRKLKI